MKTEAMCIRFQFRYYVYKIRLEFNFEEIFIILKKIKDDNIHNSNNIIQINDHKSSSGVFAKIDGSLVKLLKEE